MKKRGLGKGLSDLGVEALLMSDSETVESQKAEGLINLPVGKLHPGRYQPRRDMDQVGLEELAESIRAQGIIQPIVVRKDEEGYEIIAGERRWRAAQLVGLTEVPVIIRELDDNAALAIGLIENIQRRDLNVIEEAMALQRLLQEFGMTHQEIAAAIGKSRATVTNLLRLLNLNPDVRDLVAHGRLEMGHARALLALEGDAQSTLANTIAARKLSVRDAEQLVRNAQQKSRESTQETEPTSTTNFHQVEQDLSKRLGVGIEIKQNQKGKGRLVIRYKNTEQLEKILNYFS